jgi:hypothetical protein
MTDSNANYDIQPEPSVGIYTYDQNSRFKIAMTVDRSGPGGQDVALTAVLTDENMMAVSGAKVTATITNTLTGAIETGTMVESGITPGTYTCPATQLYNSNSIDVSFGVSKSAFTTANCGITSILYNTTHSTNSCN